MNGKKMSESAGQRFPLAGTHELELIGEEVVGTGIIIQSKFP